MKSFYLLLLLVLVNNSESQKGVYRVFGGKELHKADPYKFLVKIDVYSEVSSFCTGSIIGERWVITAAHCFDNVDYRRSDIVASQVIDNFRIVIDYIEPRNVIKHPNFNLITEPAQYDLALLRTTKVIQYDDYVHPISLSVTPLQFGDIIKLAGYGESGTGNEVPVEGLTVVSRCMDNLVYTNVFCSYDVVGAGYGDSGGPLIAKGKLVGIVTEGYCTKANHLNKCATAYASIPANLDWITDTLVKYENLEIDDNNNRYIMNLIYTRF